MADRIKLLTSLVQTTIDSAEGYERAADHAKSTDLKQVLRNAAVERRQLVEKLN